MTRPRFFNTEALVLRQMPVGEADVLLTLYTPGYGKLRAVTRGARKILSKLGGHVEPLHRCLLSLHEGRTFYVVTQAQAVESYPHLRQNLELTAFALYLAELVDRFTAEEHPNAELYLFFQRSLGWLGTLGEPAMLVRFFELHLLALSGFLPQLHRCVECQQPLEEGRHRFYPLGGGTLCLGCRPAQGAVLPLSVSALKVLRFFSTEPYERAVRLRWSRELADEIERLLSLSIRHILEGEVKAATFLAHLRRQQGQGQEAASPT